MSRHFKWDNLNKHLNNEYAKSDKSLYEPILLTLGKIADIVGADHSSPPAYFKKPRYWNNGVSNKKSYTWDSAGYQVIEQALIESRGHVVFVRKSQASSSKSISKSLKIKDILHLLSDDDHPVRKKIFAISAILILMLTIATLITTLAYHRFVIDHSRVRVQLENSNHWYEVGGRFQSEQNYERALEYFQEALRNQIEINGERSKEAAIIRLSIGESYLGLGKLYEAQEEFHHVLFIANNLRFDSKFVNSVRLRLARAYILNREFRKAHDVFDNIFASMSERELGEFTNAIAFTGSAWVAYSMNRTRDFNNFSLEENERFVSTGFLSEYEFSETIFSMMMEYFQLLAMLNLREENYEHAILFYEIGLAVIDAYEYFHNLSIPVARAILYDNIAVAALKAFRAGEMVQRKCLDGEPIERAWDYEYVIYMLEKANVLFRENLGSRNLHTAKSHTNLALAYMFINEYGIAVEHMRRAVDIFEYFFSGANDILAIAYSNLATCYNNWGKYELAERFFLKSIETYNNTFSFDIAVTFFNYAKFLIEHERIEEARTYIRRARAISNIIDSDESSLFNNIDSIEQFIYQLSEIDI